MMCIQCQITKGTNQSNSQSTKNLVYISSYTAVQLFLEMVVNTVLKSMGLFNLFTFTYQNDPSISTDKPI